MTRATSLADGQVNAAGNESHKKVLGRAMMYSDTQGRMISPVAVTNYMYL